MDDKERLYSWSLVSYASELELLNLIPLCRHFAYIRHDREECEPHWHFIATFKKNISLSAIRKCIGSAQNTFGQYMIDKCRMFAYLTHDDTDKILYERGCIFCDDFAYWEYVQKDSTTANLVFIDDLVELPPREMAIKYGKDFIRHYQQYMYFKGVLLNDNKFEKIIEKTLDK